MIMIELSSSKGEMATTMEEVFEALYDGLDNVPELSEPDKSVLAMAMLGNILGIQDGEVHVKFSSQELKDMLPEFSEYGQFFDGDNGDEFWEA